MYGTSLVIFGSIFGKEQQPVSFPIATTTTTNNNSNDTEKGTETTFIIVSTRTKMCQATTIDVAMISAQIGSPHLNMEICQLEAACDQRLLVFKGGACHEPHVHTVSGENEKNPPLNFLLWRKPVTRWET